jgi:hypothetical protein
MTDFNKFLPPLPELPYTMLTPSDCRLLMETYALSAAKAAYAAAIEDAARVVEERYKAFDTEELEMATAIRALDPAKEGKCE